jgi:hypothetical protein
MTRTEILVKIKKLRALRINSNENEAQNADQLADRLIMKYNVSEEEIASLDIKPEFYTQDDRIFSTIGAVQWKRQLILLLCKQYDAYVIEELTGTVSSDNIEHVYFVYGEDDDVASIRLAWELLLSEIDNMILNNCSGKGPVYLSSYLEGVVQAIKSNVDTLRIHLPRVKSQKKKEQAKEEASSLGLTKTKTTPKEEIAPSVDIGGSLIKDVKAYFCGIKDGMLIDLEDIISIFSSDIAAILE